MLGYAGVYSSFLRHAERTTKRHGVPTHEILREVGRRRYVGGQEDMIIDIAVALAAQEEASCRGGAVDAVLAHLYVQPHFSGPAGQATAR